MFKEQTSSFASEQNNLKHEVNAKKYQRKLYTIFGGLAVIVVLVVALLVPQSSGSTMQLSLDYKVGEHMVYQTTNIITNQIANTALNLPGVTNSQSYNSTMVQDIVDDTVEYYIVNETIANAPHLLGNIHLPSLTLNISKLDYYNNFMAPGGPLIFYNKSKDPIISAYLAQTTVQVGDVWKLPLNTGNASLGLTGEVTITFTGLQDLTVPAGTYRTMRIEVTSNVLTFHSDNSSIIKLPQGMTLQFNGTSYLEQSTCRLIKADLTQTTTLNSQGVDRTATINTEKALIQLTEP